MGFSKLHDNPFFGNGRKENIELHSRKRFSKLALDLRSSTKTTLQKEIHMATSETVCGLLKDQ